jgi:thiamine pyrophosphokinase
VIVATATASCSTPESSTRERLRRKVLRLTGYETEAIAQLNQSALDPPRLPRLESYDCRDVTGSSGDRAERAVKRAADPQNLIWVMPAEEGVSNEVIVVVAGGAPPDPQAALAVPLSPRVIAADGGLDHALALGLDVEIAVGDFDSASPEAMTRAEAGGTRIDRHPAEKEATDLELALDTAAAFGPKRILVLAGDGGRLDHLLSTLLLLGSSRYETVEIDAFIGPARAYVVRHERAIEGEVGELVSLLALHGAAEGVRTEGLMYPLAGETLEPGSSRGVSNVFVEPTARIAVERGVLLAVRPGMSADVRAEGAKWL